MTRRGIAGDVTDQLTGSVAVRVKPFRVAIMAM
jgi:hypothetical protein